MSCFSPSRCFVSAEKCCCKLSLTRVTFRLWMATPKRDYTDKLLYHQALNQVLTHQTGNYPVTCFVSNRLDLVGIISLTRKLHVSVLSVSVCFGCSCNKYNIIHTEYIGTSPYVNCSHSLPLYTSRCHTSLVFVLVLFLVAVFVCLVIFLCFRPLLGYTFSA